MEASQRIVIKNSITEYCINKNESIAEAIKKINENEHGIVFPINENGNIEGSLSDGDIRRWMLTKNSINLNEAFEEAVNHNFEFAKNNSSNKLFNLFSEKNLRAIPILDSKNRIKAIAIPAQNNTFKISNHYIGDSHPVFVIAEIGNNHQGSLENAKKLILASKNAGASCAKFQLRDLSALYNIKKESSKLDDLGTEYTIDLLKRFQLCDEDLFRAFDFCNEVGITPLCTPWDAPSVEKLESYGIEGYKLASADFTNNYLQEVVANTRKPMICSTGMCNHQEIIGGIENLYQLNADYALLHCNSTYPAPYKDINLKFIKKLKSMGNCTVGYSSHERGISAVLASIGIGARIIEKHITLNKSWEGIDHRVSLLPDEFKEMVREIRNADISLGSMESRYISQGEIINRENLGKSLFINRDMKLGELFTSNCFYIKSPGKGLSPYYKNKLIGKKTKRVLKKDDMLEKSDLNDETIKGKNYIFKRPFGIPVRYHDALELATQTNADLIEFHLSYKDLERDITEFIAQNEISRLPKNIVVHCPELFEKDHLLDLCSKDEDYREISIRNINKTIQVTEKLNHFFPLTSKPILVVNIGGFSLESHLGNHKRAELYEVFESSLRKINTENINLCPQTMPPFPWHFGGQRYHNIFINPDEIAENCKKLNLGICLDLSHSKLACNFYNINFGYFLKTVAPFTKHIHIADSSGSDGEGLQIGCGEIDFLEVANILNDHAPSASFIPEIWQGHKNMGSGFWEALEKLENVF